MAAFLGSVDWLTDWEKTTMVVLKLALALYCKNLFCNLVDKQTLLKIKHTMTMQLFLKKLKFHWKTTKPQPFFRLKCDFPTIFYLLLWLFVLSPVQLPFNVCAAACIWFFKMQFFKTEQKHTCFNKNFFTSF